MSSRQVFGWVQETRPDTLTDIQRAARLFYLQQHAFGGKVDGQSYGTATTAAMINCQTIEEKLNHANQRLSGVNIENLPWRDIVERYDRPHTLFYLDPPYWETEGYGFDWTFAEYEYMAAFMRRCQGKVIVSINDHPDIRKVFDGLWMSGLDIRYSIGNAREADGREVTGELVVANFDPTIMHGLFQIF